MRIAIIGTGITGLSAAWLLHRDHDIAIYEKDDRIGGHSNTVDAPTEYGQASVPVDTGFIVFNDTTYPNLVALFDHLDVPIHDSVMSFAVSARGGALEYSGSSLWHLFAQPRNLLRPSHHGMIGDILRFYREAPRLLTLAANDDGPSLGAYLRQGGYGRTFVDDHLLPMGAAIWSSTCAEMLNFPARSFVQFCQNHGLLRVRGRPTWRTVVGGSRTYVNKLSAPFADRVRTRCGAVRVERTPRGVAVRDTRGQWDRFDQVVMACHADQALGMLGDADRQERAILGAFRYQENTAILHRDPSLMPRRRRIWSSWNYMSEDDQAGGTAACVTYWMNRLQNIDPRHPLFVSLNPRRAPAASETIARFSYDHPQFDQVAIATQGRLSEIQGQRGLWFCGSYCGYGFHEDGLAAGLSVGEALGGQRPWTVPDASPAGRNAAPGAPLPGLAVAAE
jgi:hypothetical protein